MTTVTGTVEIGWGIPPTDYARAAVLVAPAEITMTSAGVTLLPVTATQGLGSDGSWTLNVDPLPEGYAYCFQFALYDRGFISAPRYVKIPASGTFAYDDLVDMIPPTAGGWQPGGIDPDDIADAVEDYFTSHPVTVADATTTVKGVVRLAGDLGGTASSPTVPGLASKLATADAPELIRDTMGTALVAGSNVTITPNDTNDTITISASAGSGSPADATTSSKGVVQLAGDLAGTAAAPTVKAASESVAGKVELATAAETTTGTDNTRAVHPAGLKVELDKKANLASPTFTGDPKAPTPATGDNDTSIATTAFVKAQGYALASSVPTAGEYVGVNAQTGTTYTLVLADKGKLVTCTNAGAITVTVPTNASVAFPVGAQIDVAVLGAGMVTFVGASGVTVNGTPSLVTRAQYSAVTLIKTATNTWLVVGDLA